MSFFYKIPKNISETNPQKFRSVLCEFWKNPKILIDLNFFLKYFDLKTIKMFQKNTCCHLWKIPTSYFITNFAFHISCCKCKCEKGPSGKTFSACFKTLHFVNQFYQGAGLLSNNNQHQPCPAVFLKQAFLQKEHPNTSHSRLLNLAQA